MNDKLKQYYIERARLKRKKQFKRIVFKAFFAIALSIIAFHLLGGLYWIIKTTMK